MNHLSPFFKEKFENEKLLLLKEKELSESVNDLLDSGSWIGSLSKLDSPNYAKSLTEAIPNIIQNGFQLFQGIQDTIAQFKAILNQLKSD